MKPEKQLDLLCQYYYLQLCITREMMAAYSAHTRDNTQDVLFSLFEYERCKDQLAEFWKKVEPHYCEAVALKNG